MKNEKQILNQYLKENNIRQSEQRNCVLEIFLNTERHLTANELYESVKKKYPKIGYATVYRALKVISGAGLAEEIDFGDGAKRFEHKYDHKHHDHLICVKCDKCVETVNPQIEELQKKLARDNGFTLLDHKLYMFGVCKNCGNQSIFNINNKGKRT